MNAGAQPYSIILPQKTMERTAGYLEALQAGRTQPGGRLSNLLRDTNLRSLSELEPLGNLFATKSPQIFAESAVSGDGLDWNLTELGLLGNISIAVPVTVFDDGNHQSPTPHVPPIAGTLVFTPGALLQNGRGNIPADWNESTTSDGQLSFDGYCNLYRRRLIPVLRHINERAAVEEGMRTRGLRLWDPSAIWNPGGPT